MNKYYKASVMASIIEDLSSRSRATMSDRAVFAELLPPLLPSISSFISPSIFPFHLPFPLHQKTTFFLRLVMPRQASKNCTIFNFYLFSPCL